MLFTGKSSAERAAGTKESGTHGYSNAEPNTQVICIVFCASICSGVNLGSIANLRVASVIAMIPGISLPASEQEPLTEALE